LDAVIIEMDSRNPGNLPAGCEEFDADWACTVVRAGEGEELPARWQHHPHLPVDLPGQANAEILLQIMASSHPWWLP
jgi:hypothetical protein